MQHDKFATHGQTFFSKRTELLDLPDLIQKYYTEISSAKSRFWDYYFLFMAVEGPKTPRTARLQELSERLAIMQGAMASLEEGYNAS
jgi:hypothetical protein